MAASNIHPIRGGSASGDNAGTAPPAPPSDMEARVAKLEQIAEKTGERLTAIETRLTKIETRMENMASKADVAEGTNKVIMWVVSAILLAQVLPGILKKFGM